jgi:epsilon-lactone hydrolase
MPSFQARAMATVVSLMGVKKMWYPERLNQTIAKDRRKGPARPSAKLMAEHLIREDIFNGKSVFTVHPKKNAAERHVLYLHGGGFVLSIAEPHWEFVGTMANRLNADIIVPMYPLAPEHDIDETLANLKPLYADLARRNPGRLALMGDSAGGALCLLLAMIARDNGLPPAEQLVLISPGLDFSFSTPSQVQIDKVDPIVSLRGMANLGRIRASRYDVRDPMISPLFGNLRDLPPVFIVTGTHDIVNPDAHALKTRLAAVGNPPELREYPGLMHVFPLFPLPEAATAQQQIVDFFLRHDKGTPLAKAS